MNFIEALLLISINFNQGMTTIANSDVINEFNSQTVIVSQTYPDREDYYTGDQLGLMSRLELPNYSDSRLQVLTNQNC